MITALVIAVIVLADTAGDILLTMGLRRVGQVSLSAPGQWGRFAGRLAVNPQFMSAIACMAVHFLGFLVLLSWTDLSFAFPATCLVYAAGTLGAKFILKEQITMHRWMGTMLVCAGVALVSVQ
jgi:transporter family protein